MPDTVTTPVPTLTRDDIAELIWKQRRTAGAVSIRIDDSNGNSRDLDRTIEFWLAKGKLRRQDAEEAFVALETLRRILGIPATT